MAFFTFFFLNCSVTSDSVDGTAHCSYELIQQFSQKLADFWLIFLDPKDHHGWLWWDAEKFHIWSLGKNQWPFTTQVINTHQLRVSKSSSYRKGLGTVCKKTRVWRFSYISRSPRLRVLGHRVCGPTKADCAMTHASFSLDPSWTSLVQLHHC